MKTLIIFAAVALLAGCANQRVLINENASPQQAQRDEMECRYEAMKVEASQANAAIAVLMANDAKRLCLQMRGYK